MKDFLIGVVVTVLLSFVFSVFYTFDVPPAQNGYGTQRPGDRGIVLPGGGDSPAQVIMEVSYEEPQDEKSQAEPDMEEPTEPTEPYEEYERKEPDNDMNEMLISFWHGVVTVLLGETCALAMAAAWLRMKMAQFKKRKEKNQ